MKYKKGTFKDIAGNIYGRLTAIKRLETLPGTPSVWLCQCECGNTKEVIIKNLTLGYTRSCGCLAADMKLKFKAYRYWVKKYGLKDTYEHI